jgi:hypothetical protein
MGDVIVDMANSFLKTMGKKLLDSIYSFHDAVSVTQATQTPKPSRSLRGVADTLELACNLHYDGAVGTGTGVIDGSPARTITNRPGVRKSSPFTGRFAARFAATRNGGGHKLYDSAASTFRSTVVTLRGGKYKVTVPS